jgi:hypothetical protein
MIHRARRAADCPYEPCACALGQERVRADHLPGRPVIASANGTISSRTAGRASRGEKLAPRERIAAAREFVGALVTD